MRTLLMAEGGIPPEKLVSILCFDGQIYHSRTYHK